MANSMFDIGDTVVHPQHGVGYITKLEDREFERGKIHRYYEVSIPGGSIVWVPVNRTDSGLRRVARKNEIERCREILKSHPLPLTQDGRIRQSELVAQLNRCTILAQCEVVRDLSAFVSHKPTYGTIPAFLDAIRSVLYQEWAVVEEISILEATAEISSLLERPE
jgi:RNA polymerase-interacting CarD/CdnL/TRCF family regulator